MANTIDYSKLECNKKYYMNAPEFIRITKDKFITDMAIIGGDLVFHFFGSKTTWVKWSNEKIDALFSEIFGAQVKDMTGLLEKKVKELKSITFALREIKNDTAKIQKSYESQLPMYEQGKSWDESKHLQTWSYIVKNISDPYLDVKAKKIVDGIETILD